PQMYIDHLVMICQEIKHVLKKSGSFYLNIGDTYFGGKGKSGSEEPDEFTLRKKQGLMQGKASTYQGDRPSDICKRDKWLQPKQLLLIPSRVAIALQDDGWILRSDIIWKKPNPLPSSVKDRLSNTFEHVFHLVKSRRYYYDLNSIRTPHAVAVERWKTPYAKKKNSKYVEDLAACGSNDKKSTMFHPDGKNPGNTFEYTVNENEPQGNTAIKQRMAYRRRVLGMDHDYCPDHPKGRNSGDVICPESWGVDKNQEYHGEGKHNPKGQSPSDLKRNIVESFKDNPKG
ncbi:unnamed protein product, partial [marine sediment metagenome]